MHTSLTTFSVSTSDRPVHEGVEFKGSGSDYETQVYYVGVTRDLQEIHCDYSRLSVSD